MHQLCALTDNVVCKRGSGYDLFLLSLFHILLCFDIPVSVEKCIDFLPVALIEALDSILESPC